MLQENKYSIIYTTPKNQWRYDFENSKLERLGRTIKKKTVNGRLAPIMEIGVLEQFNVRSDLFKKVPEYWIQLYESVVERRNRNNSQGFCEEI